MKLYYYPGACSLAVHIALIEADIPYTLVSINHEKITEDGQDFLHVNPKGYIPTIDVGNGMVLTENQVILAYVSEISRKLLPNDEFLKWRMLETLAYMVTEIHGAYIPYFKNFPEVDKERSRDKLNKAFYLLSQQLGDKSYLIDEYITIADCYLFWAIRVARKFNIEFSSNLNDLYLRMEQLPSVAQALSEEGLL